MRTVERRDGDEYFDISKDQSEYVRLAQWRYEILDRKLNAFANPFKYIWIDPNLISFRTTIHNKAKERQGSKLYDICTILDGDWDVTKAMNTDIQHDLLYNAVYQHFLTGVPWKDTGVIEAKLKAIAISSRGVVDGCRNEEELIRRYNRLDGVFESIRTEGFRYQIEGLSNEMFVTIGRYGTLFLASGGNHRLAIAKLLRLDVIPCLVMTRHKSWQDLKELVSLGVTVANDDRLAVARSILEHHPDR